MKISISNRQRLIKLPPRWLYKVSAEILTQLDCSHAELSILLLRDKPMQKLNRQYRGKDKPTDVLSFSMQEGEGLVSTNVLGDVVLSLETAARQANDHKRTLEQEVAHLLTHGILHLLGYDHEISSVEAKRMRDREISIMKALESAHLIPMLGEERQA